MSIITDEQAKAFLTGKYECSNCGAEMAFEDEWKDTLICPECGHEIDYDRYGCESDEEFEEIYPTLDEVLARED